MRPIRTLCALSLVVAAGCSGGSGSGGNDNGSIFGSNNNSGNAGDGNDGNAAHDAGGTGGGDGDGDGNGDGSGDGTTGKDAGSTSGMDAGHGGGDEHDAGSDPVAHDAGTTDDAGSMTADASTPPPPKCTGAVPGVSGPVPAFTKQEISTLTGAAYLRPADVNNDGYDEYLLTSLAEGIDLTQILSGVPLANGGAYVLSRKGGPAKGTLGTWETTKGFDKSENVGFPNESEWFDVDGDKINDWVIAAGFLTKPTGKLLWLKGASNGTFGKPQYVTVPDAKCWYHVALPLDMDADGDNDLVTTCHVGDTGNVNGPSRMQWFENDGKGKFTSHAIGDGGGSLIELYDLDDDGDMDVVAPQFFGPKALVWFEQTGAKGSAWTQHLINETTGRGFIVKFADMNGDGKLDMLYGNHNNQNADQAINQKMGIYWFEIPGKDVIRGLANWNDSMHVVHEGFEVAGSGNGNSAGAPGMLNVGDIDGDCDMDVTASGDGDEGLYVFVQQASGFEKLELSNDPGNANSGAQVLVDLDRDGDQDILWAVFGPQGLSLSSHVYAFLHK